MKLSFVFLCLSLAALLFASTSSAKKNGALSRSKQVKKDSSAFLAAGRSSQAAKIARNRKRALRRRLKKRVGATKGVKKASAGAGKSSQEGCAAKGDRSKLALRFFPKTLVELIGAYLEGFSVVFERNWSAAYNEDRVAVDSERHYLITPQDVQASSHSGGEPVNIGSPGLSNFRDFHSSHDGRSVFFICKNQEQVSNFRLGRTARWLVQDTSTKSLKSVTPESGESSFVGHGFMLSANGKTLVSTSWTASTTSVYQIKGHEITASVSKKDDFDGYACAVSRNGNRILLLCEWKEQFEIHDISGDGSNSVLEINYAGATGVGSCALNSDGSKAAFIYDDRKLYIVDVDKQKGSISVNQLAPIDIPDSVLVYRLIYDAKDRVYAFDGGNLLLVDPSKRECVSLDKAEVPQGHWLQSSAISLNGDYIALLIRSADKREKGEHQYRIVVKRDTKDVLMRLYIHGF